MNFTKYIDWFVSNLVVFSTYLLTLLLWSLFRYYFDNETLSSLVYFPFGILILGFLYFGNKIVYGIFIGQYCYYSICQNYKLTSPFDDLSTLSIVNIISVPITLYMVNKSNYKIDYRKKYNLNKKNIYYVLLFIVFSSLIFGLILFLFSLLNEIVTNYYIFIIGNIIGSFFLIIGLKVIVNLTKLTENYFKLYS